MKYCFRDKNGHFKKNINSASDLYTLRYFFYPPLYSQTFEKSRGKIYPKAHFLQNSAKGKKMEEKYEIFGNFPEKKENKKRESFFSKRGYGSTTIVN